MDIGLVIIGTELLTGNRSDQHLPKMIELLHARGLDLAWCQYLGDSPSRLTQTLASTMRSGDLVFSFGGIGATPDDHTRAAAAKASGRALVRHDELAAIIEARFGAQAYPQRIRMAHLPNECTLIPNPVNQIAGFSIGHHHFVPGFPQMAWPMVQWVLDTHYNALHSSERSVERLLTVPNTGEGALINIMECFVAKFPDMQFSCLPHMEDEYRETELGVRGRGNAVETAYQWLCCELTNSEFVWEARPNRKTSTPAQEKTSE
jgi:molybdopterin-biosynthesis enzyme MoeA-like protein